MADVFRMPTQPATASSAPDVSFLYNPIQVPGIHCKTPESHQVPIELRLLT